MPTSENFRVSRIDRELELGIENPLTALCFSIIMDHMRTTIDLDDELYRRLRIYCAERNLTMADVIRRQLEKLLAKDEKKVKS